MSEPIISRIGSISHQEQADTHDAATKLFADTMRSELRIALDALARARTDYPHVVMALTATMKVVNRVEGAILSSTRDALEKFHGEQS